MKPVKIWEGVENGKYDTSVVLTESIVGLQQSWEGGTDYVGLDTEHAIDIAFTILKELCPTLHEALSQLNVDKDSKV